MPLSDAPQASDSCGTVSTPDWICVNRSISMATRRARVRSNARNSSMRCAGFGSSASASMSRSTRADPNRSVRGDSDA